MISTTIAQLATGRHDNAVRGAIQRTVAQTIRPYALLIAILYALLDVSFLTTGTLTTQSHWQVLLAADLTTECLLTAVVVFGTATRLAAPGRAHVVAAVMTGDLYLNTALLLSFKGSAFDLMNLALIVVGLTPLTLAVGAWLLNAITALSILMVFSVHHPLAEYAALGYAVVVAVFLSLGWMLTQRAIVLRLERSAAAQRRAGEATTAALQQLSSITESARDGIVTVDDRGRITGWNAGAEALLGYPREEILGSPVTALIPAEFRAAHAEGFATATTAGLSSAAGRPLELAAVRRDGETVAVEVSLGSWDADGRRYFSAVLRDLTDRRAAEQVRREAESLSIRRRSALAVHDGVVQGLAVGLYSLEAGDTGQATAALERTLASARRIISDTLTDGDVDTALATLRTGASDAGTGAAPRR